MKVPPPEKVVATCTAVMAYFMTVKSILHAVVPPPLQRFIGSFLQSRFNAHPSSKSLIVEDRDLSGRKNPVYEDILEYFGAKVRDSGNKIRVSREPELKNIHLSLSLDDVVDDQLEGIHIQCKYCKVERNEPYVEKTAAEMRTKNRIIMIHSNSATNRWEKMTLIHPSTFDTMALSQEVRRVLINDIDRFIGKREYYKKVGKAWKRGYLLYGPPGTGKSSLVAAIANHLKFDIYDLQLTSVKEDSTLRKLLLTISNGSILVVEDIDRSVKLEPEPKEKGLSLAGILNCIDGIWSSCGEERIIIFTTNNKDAIDAALLRPGRMDVHIYLGHCCFDGFKTLAFNYLDLEQHALFPVVERLIQGEVITPAQVAEVFMKTDDKDLAMENLIQLLEVTRSRTS